MNVYRIETDTNRLTIHTPADPEPAEASEPFHDQAGLALIATSWSLARLVDIWNHLPGATRVNKFTDRKTAIARIWKALQSLPQASPPEPDPEVEDASSFAHDGAHRPGSAQPVAQRAKKTNGARGDSKRRERPLSVEPKARDQKAMKKDTLLILLQRAEGATLAELMTVTGWQPHTVRGFLSGTLGKKMGLPVVSTKAANGTRTYSIGIDSPATPPKTFRKSAPRST